MAIAGKVAITPGGEWSATVAYDKLVVVTYNNNVYLSTKPSTGVEPTDTEHWMLLVENVTQEQYNNIINGTTAVGNANKLGGKGASEFMRCRSDLYANTIFGSNDLNDWVSIHGAFCSVGGSVNVPSGTDGWGDIFIFGTDNGSHITQIFRPWNTAGLYWRYKYNDSWFDWKKLAHDADLANYMPLSGGTIEIPQGSPLFALKNNLRNIENYLEYSTGRYRLIDITNGKDIITSLADGTNTFNGTATGNVPLNGDSDIWGVVKILRDSTVPLQLSSVNSTVNLINFQNLNGTLGYLGFNDADKPYIWGSDGQAKGEILHTGNKPTGSYTGNGSGSLREVATGGTGNVITIIGSNNTKAIIIGTGGFAIGTNGNIYELPVGTVYMSNGLMTTATDDVAVNANGVTYTYHVL